MEIYWKFKFKNAFKFRKCLITSMQIIFLIAFHTESVLLFVHVHIFHRLFLHSWIFASLQLSVRAFHFHPCLHSISIHACMLVFLPFCNLKFCQPCILASWYSWILATLLLLFYPCIFACLHACILVFLYFLSFLHFCILASLLAFLLS